MPLERTAQNPHRAAIESGHVLFERGMSLHCGIVCSLCVSFSHFSIATLSASRFSHQEIKDTRGAITQATLSLHALKPFATEKGVVLTGKKLTKKRTDEPERTFHEAKALQAKAYFRLGSAQMVTEEYDEAVQTFGRCVHSTKEAGMTLDSVVVRKVNEAKRLCKGKKDRQRKKFKFMFASSNDEDTKHPEVED